MKTAIALAAALFATPLMAAVTPLAGVADEETVISSGVIEEFHRGHGDVLFVRDRTNRWFRLQLNEGCLKPPLIVQQVTFSNDTPGQRIDRFTRVTLPESGRVCAIESIRRSAAPPQVDSKSPVTLD